MLRFIRKRKRATASVGVLTAAAVALGVMAFTHPGFTTTDVDMHDGGVWVTNLETSQIGHLNYQAGELDSGLTTSSTNFDVVQNDGTVIALDHTNASLNPIDTGQASFRGDIPLPGTVSVSIRGGTVTVLNEYDGRLWAVNAESIGSLNFEEQDPLAVLGAGGVATADEAGNVHAASIEDGLAYHWQRGDAGFELASEQPREELSNATELTITAVGENPIVFDAPAGKLLLPESVTDAPRDAVLQHPSADGAEVILASGSSLIRQPMSGGDAQVEEFASGGQAVAPVRVDSCIHAAWPGEARVVRLCDDASANIDEVVEVPMSGDVLFREHRGVVALNDVRSGVSWLMSDELIMVDNWADLVPPVSEEETEEQDESMDDTIDNVAPDPTEENNEPIANDDTIFGARTGRSTLVPVLHNDTDQDGDILTVSLVGEAPAGVRISPVHNSSQFQVEIPNDYNSNAVNFRYEVHDGRGGKDQATVTLAIRDESQNEAPEELREQSFEVEQRAEYEHSVFDSWFDPDGDDLFLVDAYSDSGDTVRFSPNGRIMYTATGEPGPTTMTIVVSDGVAEQEGKIEVEVRERGTSSPIANADYASVAEDQSISVKPLANDFLPAGENARLASATPRGDITVDLDRTTNTLHITGGSVGTHFVDYTVASGPNQAQGHVRVDVTEPIEDAQPVAVRDVALLPMGGEALIDLTENDVDPTGGVLVVQSIETHGTPLEVQLKRRHMLRIDDQHGLIERTTLTYHISNGAGTAVGEIVVIPIEPPDKPRNPVAMDDTATLREGDYLSVDVTNNDFSPDSVPFTVNPELVESSLLPEEGHVFVDGDDIRVHVGVGGPSYVDVTYEIADTHGNSDTALLRVEVEPRDTETNNPPHARDVTSRVLAGNEVRIPIPLNGIDPDGDGVVLVGWETAPGMGRITEVGPDYFDFEAFRSDSGTTTFQYRVRDRWGAEAVSSVTIGIAQPSSVNQPPQAVLDEVWVRPDRAVAVSVLDNDSDPDGDELTLTGVNIDDAPSEFSGLGLGEESPTVNFTAPSDSGEYTLEYTIKDARGASAIGAISVRVSEDAPLLSPSAVDDVVDVADLTIGEPFVVPVLENDRDPDGDPAELGVEVLTGAGEIVTDGVQVVPSEEFQIVTYRVTDQDGGQGSAFIFVPGVGEQLPFISSETKLYIGSGQPLDIELARYVEMPNGGTPRITTEDTVSATNANDDSLVVDEHHLVYTSELGYVGEAAISFEITDGSGPDDPNGVTAKLTIPIQVTPSSEVPPEFEGAEIPVQPGEAPTEFDLRLATWDPDDGDVDEMEYDLIGGEVAGVSVSIEGQSIFVSADPEVPPGTRGTYEIQLTDPAGNGVPGAVTVEVVESTRPMPRAAADTGETDQGVEISINVIENDFNPFQNIGETLNVREVQVLRGEVANGPSTDGTNVTVTPAQDFSGVLTLQYRIEDATQSNNRTAVGNVEINVRGRPDAPLRPNVNSIGDSEVSLSWAAPASNGAPITGYIVQWDGGSQECSSTSCTVTGLTNDTVYNFQIVAVNDVGESDPSPASIDARPDVRPEQPNPPVAARGDQELTITWERPENRGSAITHYILEISGPIPPGESAQVLVEGTSYTWPNLTNGAGYTFRVQAHNLADEPSEWSRESREEIPAGPPGAPGDVIASANQLGGSTNQVAVSWTAADPNGRAVSQYTIVPYIGGAAQNNMQRTVGGSTLHYTYESLRVNEGAYTFRVFATNEVDDGESTESASIRIVNAPEAPTVEHYADRDRAAGIRITPGALNGYRSQEVTYEYRASGGSWTRIATGDQTISGLSNTPQSIEVRAVASTDGVSNTSAVSSVRVSPYGLPPKPSISASATKTGVDFTWSLNGTNGRDITQVQTRERVNGGGWSDWRDRNGTSGKPTVNGSDGQTIEMQIRVRDSEGQWSATPHNSASAKVEPSWRVWIERGGQKCKGGACGPSMIMHYEGISAGTYNIGCWQGSPGNYFHRSWQNESGSNYTVNLGSSGSLTDSQGLGYCFTNNSGSVGMDILSGTDVVYRSETKSWP